MVEFKSLADVAAHPFANPKHRRAVEDAVRQLVEDLPDPDYPYNPDTDGWVVLVEKGDGENVLSAFTGCPLNETPWEGGSRDRRTSCITAYICTNNSFALTIVFPNDGGFLSAATRKHLLEELS